MNHHLTETQADVLDAIRAYIAENPRPPSLRDLCDMTGRRSVGSIVDIVRQLEYKRYIKRGPGHRQIKLLQGPCPHCGRGGET